MAKINILQCNLQRSTAAHALMEKTASENKAAVVIIPEPNWNLARRGKFTTDQSTDVAIRTYPLWCPPILDSNNGPGFAWIELPQVIIYGCYISPNAHIEAYRSYITSLQRNVRQHKKEVIIAGDFNAKSHAWGSKREDEHGTVLMEMIASENLVVLNCGNEPTFIRGSSTSCIDVTISTEKISSSVTDWKVLSHVETLSDHPCIKFCLALGSRGTEYKAPTTEGWKYSARLEEKCRAEIRQVFQEENKRCLNAEKCTELLTVACNNSLPKKALPTSRKPVYWWNKDIAELRKICIGKRRATTRANRMRSMAAEEVERMHLEYTRSRKELRKMIITRKKECWKQVQNDIDSDTWGLGYKIVTKKFVKSININIALNEKLEIVRTLFPPNPPVFHRREELDQPVKMFTGVELQKAASKLKCGKAAGPDNLLPEIVRLFANTVPDECLNMMNQYLNCGIFPKAWKNARLVLLKKPAKNTSTTVSYRPLCLLNILGKLYEHLLVQRLKSECDDLSESQFGFREGKSTIDAANAVISIAKNERKKAFNNRGQCLLITLDIKNAFNTVPWAGVIEALRHKNTPPYLIRVIKSYLHERSISVDGVCVEVNTGVPQGSVMGPFLWNMYYDEILRVKLLKDVHSVAFADDLALIITAKSQETLVEKANLTIWEIKNHLETHMQLTLAPEKTEMVLLSSKRNVANMNLMVGNINVPSSPMIKYLGIWLDRNIKMEGHLNKAIEKAERAAQNISRLMPNLEGPRSSKRRILCSVVLSILLYGAPLWHDVLRFARNKDKLVRCMRRPKIRVCSAYRTISNVALDVITGIPPIYLLIKERARVYEHGDREAAGKTLLEDWQAEWEDGRNDKAIWTKSLINQIGKWKNRKHGEVNYYWTQFLSGHGQFKVYYQKMNLCNSGICIYCSEVDTAGHTFFACTRWANLRNGINKAIGVPLHEENVIDIALQSAEKWDHIGGYIEKILRQKDKDFRRM